MNGQLVQWNNIKRLEIGLRIYGNLLCNKDSILNLRVKIDILINGIEIIGQLFGI